MSVVHFFLFYSCFFVPMGSVNRPALAHTIPWCQTGDTPQCEPVMTHDVYIRFRHRWVIAFFNLVLLISIFTAYKDNALKRMPWDLTDDNYRESSWDKANKCYPNTNIGCPPSPVNRTSAGYVETHSIPNLTISKWGSIILGVWSYLSHKYTLTSVQTRSISRDCTFAWHHQPCPSRRGGH